MTDIYHKSLIMGNILSYLHHDAPYKGDKATFDSGVDPYESSSESG